MGEIKNFWINFVEGRISVPAMLRETEKRPELLDWLTSAAGPECKTYCHRGDQAEGAAPEVVPFDAALQIRVCIHDDRGGDTLLSRYLNIHDCFSRVLTGAFPEEGIQVDRTLDERYCFMLEACPRYIGGHEADHILEEELSKLPRELDRSHRARLFHKQMKHVFHVRVKHPEWVNDPQWPIGTGGKPMRFLRQRRRLGKEYQGTCCTRYYFEDLETGEIRVVEQSLD